MATSKVRTTTTCLLLTPSQREAVTKVKRCLHELRGRFAGLHRGDASPAKRSRRSMDPSTDEGMRVLRDRNVISIVGGRGSGKTTVLETVLREVEEESPTAILLRPIYPEAFLVGRHPIGWIAAALKPCVDRTAAQLRVKKRAEDAAQLMEAYSQFCNRAQTFLLVQGRGLEFSADAMVRKSDLLAAASESGLSLTQKLDQLIDMLLTLRGDMSIHMPGEVSSAPLLVVSFDDVDLHPDRMSSIMEVLPVLSRLPQTAVLIAADQVLVRAQFGRNCLELVSKDGAPTALQLAEDQFMKRMPFDLQFPLADLTLAERLTFRPEGQPSSLRHVLAELQMRQTGHGPQSLADLFDLSWNGMALAHSAGVLPSLYAAMLPPDPRSLLNLYGILSRHKRGLSGLRTNSADRLGSEMYKKAFHALLVDMVDFLAHRSVHYLDLLRRLYDWRTYPDCIRVDAHDLVSGVSIDSPRGLKENGGEALEIRRFYVEYRGEELPPTVAALVNFTQELSSCPAVVDYSEGISTPGGLSSKTMPLRSKDARLGWPRPHFDSFINHQAFEIRWKASTRSVFDNDADKRPRNRRPCVSTHTFLFYCYCSAIIESVCVNGRRAPLVGEEDLMRSPAWESLVARASGIMKELHDAAEAGDTFARGVRADLDTWVSRDLAWMSAKDAALDEEVAKRASWLRAAISQAVALPREMLKAGQRDADRHREELDAILPQVSLAEIDLDRLVRDLMAGKDEATRTAMLALQMDRRPSRKRDMLTGIMRQLGHRVPGIRSEFSSELGPSREEGCADS